MHKKIITVISFLIILALIVGLIISSLNLKNKPKEETYFGIKYKSDKNIAEMLKQIKDANTIYIIRIGEKNYIQGTNAPTMYLSQILVFYDKRVVSFTYNKTTKKCYVVDSNAKLTLDHKPEECFNALKSNNVKLILEEKLLKDPEIVLKDKNVNIFFSYKELPTKTVRNFLLILYPDLDEAEETISNASSNILKGIKDANIKK